MKYTVEWLTCWEELAEYATEWNRLAGPVPFRRWEWLAGWWQHYGQPEPTRRQLAVGVVKSPSDGLIGLAPWYMERSAIRGRCLRFLGDGEVCSDHLSLLCRPGQEKQLADALAQSLLAGMPTASVQNSFPTHSNANQAGRTDANGPVVPAGRRPLRWDLLELADVDLHDAAVGALVQAMAERGAQLDRKPAGHCWVIPLPSTWESFLQRLSRPHRIRLRRIEKRFFAPGRAVLHTLKDPEQLPWAMDLLVRLHRQRRRQLGQPDQFVSARFAEFHRQIAPELLAAGLLELHWLEVDGQPVAVEYHLVGNATLYAYQSGIAPTAQCPSPGEWLHLATIRRAIELGYQQFDFLRGDEPYKAHWRALPQATETFWIVAPHRTAQWRYGLWQTARRWKHRLRTWLGRTQNISPGQAPSAPFPHIPSSSAEIQAAAEELPDRSEEISGDGSAQGSKRERITLVK